MSVPAYIGVGSNLDGPVRQVQQAIEALAALAAPGELQVSRLYSTAPVGYRQQPRFINALVGFETDGGPAGLLRRLLAIEQDRGRRRDGMRWGPRTLDLDLLIYGASRCETPELTLPHPRMAERAFVLVPLADIAPRDLAIPGHGRLGELLARLPAGAVAEVTPISGSDGGPRDRAVGGRP